MDQDVKIMVVDDTITYRQILSKVVESLPNSKLVGTAISGSTAIMKLEKLKPDLILLDVMMPDMDGPTTLKEVKKKWPEIQIVMISSYDMNNARATLQSLEDGALDFIPKPVVANKELGMKELQDRLTPLISLIFEKKAHLKGVKKEVPPYSPSKSPPPLPSKQKPLTEMTPLSSRRKGSQFDLVVIGISTGGPNALQKLMPVIHPDLSCPIIIVQHMPPMFTNSLAERLQKLTKLTVKEASAGELLQKGYVYVAPGGQHLIIRKSKTQPGSPFEMGLSDMPPVNHCKPSVDVLFRSVSQFFDKNVLSIVMTGMGRDGTQGVDVLKKKGAWCLVQDEKTSVVWGMPRSVFEKGLADEVLPLDEIGFRINQLIME